MDTVFVRCNDMEQIVQSLLAPSIVPRMAIVYWMSLVMPIVHVIKAGKGRTVRCPVVGLSVGHMPFVRVKYASANQGGLELIVPGENSVHLQMGVVDV